jgi:phosphatidylglycerophosphate synthase
VLTLTRANLPVSVTGDGRVLGLLALISDLADGRLARQLGTVTPFGRDADSIADAAFWTWFALRHEPNRAIRLLALGAWAVPVATVTAISLGRGRMADPPRPQIARPAAAMQAVLVARALIRGSTIMPAGAPPHR